MIRSGISSCAPSRSAWAAWGLLAAHAAALAQVDAAMPSRDALEQCRALPQDAQRLACYDKLLPVYRASRREPAIALPPVQPATTAAAPPSVPSPPAAASEFGLPRKPAAAEAANAIASQIAGRFDGWTRGQTITLVNGQEWRVTEDTIGVYRVQDPKVVVRRGTLGSFFMEIEGIAQTPRVQRVK